MDAQLHDGKIVPMHRTKNLDLEVEDDLILIIESFVGTDKGKGLKMEKWVHANLKTIATMRS